MAYRATGDLEQAKFHLERRGPVGVRPKDPLVDGLSGLIQGERVNLIRGRLAFGAGQFEQAAQAFAKAVDADSDSVRARVNFGVTLDKLGQREKAVEQFEAALRLDSNNLTAHFNLGIIMAQQGNHQAAIKHYGSMVEVRPKDLEANRELAKSLLKVGRLEDAAQKFSVVVALAPGDESSLIELADLMVRGGRYKQSIDLLSRASSCESLLKVGRLEDAAGSKVFCGGGARTGRRVIWIDRAGGSDGARWPLRKLTR